MFLDNMVDTLRAAIVLGNGAYPVLVEERGMQFVITNINIVDRDNHMREANVPIVMREGHKYVSERAIKRAFRELNVRWVKPDWNLGDL